MENRKVWFITGASKGLGLTLAKKLLAKGYTVAATSRSKKALIDAIGNASLNFLPLEMDLVSEKSVKNAIEVAINHFKTIDVVVNNAGYGQLGTLEELSDREARENYDINVFGLLNVIRAVMPHYRNNKSGHFFNISSIGGFTGNFVNAGIYCSTKFAVSGITETLEAEGKAFGIKATLVYPGYFRTDFLSSGSIKTPKNPIYDYQEARKSESFHLNEINGNQPNDPEKAADVLIQMAKEENPPLHLFLGADALEMVEQKINTIEVEVEKWKSTSLSTAFKN
jgi:NAD(P)-dependent dehydrogenase (short-subunit alcohol dehydrogenase family)